MRVLANARRLNANLLLNTGPLPDGSIHPEDVRTLREVGRRIRRDGFPEPKKSAALEKRDASRGAPGSTDE